MRFAVPFILRAALLAALIGPASEAARAGSPRAVPGSNTLPLVFGMSPAEVARGLGVPLYRVGGTRRDVVLMTPAFGAADLRPRQDRLLLQFRAGRLTGWKGDYGVNWMWR